MKFVIQRTNAAKCEVNNEITGQIEKGLCVFIGVGKGDDKKIADKMIQKLVNMRIFEDENEKINLSVQDINGGLLLISQFTLYANCRKGNRPSFTDSESPDAANSMYEYIISECKKVMRENGSIKAVETGIFGADMQISVENDGPFTVILDSYDLAIN